MKILKFAGLVRNLQPQVEQPDAAASGAPIVLATLPDLSSDIAIGDWDDLLSAVSMRLKQTVFGPLHDLPESARDTAQRVRATVLDCVAALGQIHTTLQHEVGRLQRLESEVLEARRALAEARAELVGTRAGERHSRRMALHDDLTSLPNRNFFREWLDHALVQAEPEQRGLAVMYLDLDGFKPINDEHGHETGDELLRIVAERLTRAVRAEDLVSRLGGDEFGCVLADLSNREHLGHLAIKLFHAVSAPLKIGPLELSVRPSIGIAMWPADGSTGDDLLRKADHAMYRAKRERTGHAFFTEALPG